MDLKLSVFLLMFLLITSCGGGKMIVGSEIANPIMSSKDIIQCIGRGLRPDKLGLNGTNLEKECKYCNKTITKTYGLTCHLKICKKKKESNILTLNHFIRCDFDFSY